MKVEFQILDSTVCDTLYCIAGRKKYAWFSYKKNKDLAWGHNASGLMLQTRYVPHKQHHTTVSRVSILPKRGCSVINCQIFATLEYRALSRAKSCAQLQLVESCNHNNNSNKAVTLLLSTKLLTQNQLLCMLPWLYGNKLPTTHLALWMGSSTWAFTVKYNINIWISIGVIVHLHVYSWLQHTS